MYYLRQPAPSLRLARLTYRIRCLHAYCQHQRTQVQPMSEERSCRTKCWLTSVTLTYKSGKGKWMERCLSILEWGDERGNKYGLSCEGTQIKLLRRELGQKESRALFPHFTTVVVPIMCRNLCNCWCFIVLQPFSMST